MTDQLREARRWFRDNEDDPERHCYRSDDGEEVVIYADRSTAERMIEALTATPSSDEAALREAARAVVANADPDDDFDGTRVPRPPVLPRGALRGPGRRPAVSLTCSVVIFDKRTRTVRLCSREAARMIEARGASLLAVCGRHLPRVRKALGIVEAPAQPLPDPLEDAADV